LEKKILIYVAIGVIVAILGVVAILPSSGILKNVIPRNTNTPSALTSVITEVKPLDIQYNGSSVLSVTNRDAVIETKFILTNPNDNTLIIEMLSYDVYVNGVNIGHGQYGQRYEGTWESSYYLPLTQHNSETITNKAQLRNDGNNPQVWSALQNGTEKIRISGTAYYSTHSALSGQSYSKDFEFTK
jgi:LEA14-like dessication related protein